MNLLNFSQNQKTFVLIMIKKDYNISSAPTPMGKYPHSKKVGNLLFLSGIGSRNPKDNSIPDNFKDECHAVFKNVNIILNKSGAHWVDLVDITVFLTNMKKNFDTFNSIYSDYFKNTSPCRTTIEVKSLPSPISIELKCIALLRDDK
mgnify:CR=1 FL=1